jgi:C-terminal processing protease CtpA/Prc
LGFALAPSADGSLTIVGVVQNSNAERQGLRDGDTLVELDGVAAAQMNVSVFRAAGARGTPIRIVVEREGKRLEFVVSR